LNNKGNAPFGKQHHNLERVGQLAIDDGAAHASGIEDSQGIKESSHRTGNVPVGLFDRLGKVQRGIAVFIYYQNRLGTEHRVPLLSGSAESLSREMLIQSFAMCVERS
jgi:hypothetical protein